MDFSFMDGFFLMEIDMNVRNGFLKYIFRGKKTIFDPKMADHLNFGSTSRIFFQSNERDQEVHKNYILFTKKKF